VKYLKYFKDVSSIFEKIDYTETCDSDYWLDSIINHKRDVGFVYLDDKLKSRVIENNLKYIKVKQNIDYDNNVYVVYRDKEKADRVLFILNKNGGFLKDKTPEEALEIGRALEYSDYSINKYLMSKYNTNINSLISK